MKKYFLLGLMIAIAPNICFGAGARYTQLVREKQRKMEELEKCMGATNGLKIAGLSTIGLTAVGVAGNVAEAKKLDEYESGIKSKEKELEKLNKDIATTQKEIDEKKAEEEAKKAELEYNLYQVNCRLSGGFIADDTCWCGKNKHPNSTGKCVKDEKDEVASGSSTALTTNGQSASGQSGSFATKTTTNVSQQIKKANCEKNGHWVNDKCQCMNGFRVDDEGKCVRLLDEVVITPAENTDTNNPNMLKNVVARDIAAINATPASLGAKIYVSGYNIDQLPEDLYDDIYSAMEEFTSKCDENEGWFADYPDDKSWDSNYANTSKLNPDDVWEYTERYVLAQCVQN